EDVEAEPPLAVDDRKCIPSKRRNVEGEWRDRQRPEIGQEGVEGEHDQDDEGAQIAECQAGSRHCAPDTRGRTENPGVEDDPTAALRPPDGSRNQEGSGTRIKSIPVIFLNEPVRPGSLRPPN